MPQQRRLAGAGLADDGDEDTLRDLDRDIVERRGGVRAIDLGHVFESDQGRHPALSHFMAAASTGLPKIVDMETIAI